MAAPSGEMTAVGFETTPLRTGAWSQRLRPLGQTVPQRTPFLTGFQASKDPPLPTGFQSSKNSFLYRIVILKDFLFQRIAFFKGSLPLRDCIPESIPSRKPQDTPGYPQNTPRIPPGCPQDTPRIPPGYPQDTTRIAPGYSEDTPRIACPRARACLRART